MPIKIVQQHYSFVTKSGTSSGLASHFDLLRGHETWSPPSLPPPPILDRVQGHFLFKKELKVEMINKQYGRLQPTKVVQK